MASSADKVMQYVERELEKDPDVSNETLFEGAKKINRAVAKLTPRQFHAKYPLQVKRRKGSGKGRKRTTGAKKKTAKRRTAAKGRKRATKATGSAADNGNHEAVRRVMLRFAQDLSAAEDQSQTIGVLAKLDRYVTDIMKAATN